MSRTKCALSILLFIILSFQSFSQEFQIRSYIGQTFYQGDLSPLTSAFSFSTGHPAVSVFAGGNVTPAIMVGGRFMKAHISGYDEDSFYKWKLLRNLHFESPIYEFGLVTELYLNKVFSNMDRLGVDIYLTSGLNVFRFEPRAHYDGQYVDLPELSTEGQGLPQYPGKKPYSQTQISIPLGIGFSFKIADNMKVGFEVAPRMTFTDYLDDVSDSYIPFDILESERGNTAALLSDRRWELVSADNTLLRTSDQRGNPHNNDWYLYTGVHFGYVIKNNKTVTKKREDKKSKK